jgi:bis(5'-adenosyl)-triphosphatase
MRMLSVLKILFLIPVRNNHRLISRVTIMNSASNNIYFGPYKLDKSQIFYESELCYGLVNLKPIVPGHILIIPKRVCTRFSELSPAEVSDLYSSVWKLSSRIESHYGAEALNIAMQDGAAAGQSVPHVHVHMLPRKPGDFNRNDDVYEELERQELNNVFRADAERLPRTLEDMAVEATQLRILLSDLN